MSKNDKHTPGPWMAEKMKDRKVREWAIRAPGNFPCVSYELASLSGYDPIHNKANARLIAAAPDLLEALQKIVNHSDAGTAAIHERLVTEARSAIAKATGERQ